VRYFGGTKLGVGGLIHAYKTATADALANAQTVEKYETSFIKIEFEYAQMNEVMSLVKEFNLNIRKQEFEVSCQLLIEARNQLRETLLAKLHKIDGVHAGNENDNSGS
jgi:putative IMPACT (imprinted ancient) family translation regulator